MVSSVTTSETYMFLLVESQPWVVVAFTAASDQSDASGRHMFHVIGARYVPATFGRYTVYAASSSTSSPRVLSLPGTCDIYIMLLRLFDKGASDITNPIRRL